MKTALFNEGYDRPQICIIEISTESVLCSSLAKFTTEEWEEIDHNK